MSMEMEMGRSSVSKYAYVLEQVLVPGGAYYDMYGTETKYSPEQLEEMRQGFNAKGGHVKSISLRAQKGKLKGEIVSSSKSANGSQSWA